MDEEENDENELDYQYDSDQEYHYEDNEEDDDQEETDMNTSKSNANSIPIPNSTTSVTSSVPIPVAVLSTANNERMEISEKRTELNTNLAIAKSYDSNFMKVDDDDNLASTSLSSPNATGASKISKTDSSRKSNQFHPSQSGKLKIPDGSFFISEYSVIAVIMENLINEVATLLDLNYDIALILLQYCRWNKEKLMDTFYSSSESSSEKLLEECGVDLFTDECLNSLKLYQTYFNNLSNIQNMNNIIAKMDPVAKTGSMSPPPSATTTAAVVTAMVRASTTSSSSSSSSTVMTTSTEQFMCEVCGDMTPNMEAIGLGE